jgi:hypothetical protein
MLAVRQIAETRVELLSSLAHEEGIDTWHVSRQSIGWVDTTAQTSS